MIMIIKWTLLMVAVLCGSLMVWDMIDYCMTTIKEPCNGDFYEDEESGN